MGTLLIPRGNFPWGVVTKGKQPRGLAFQILILRKVWDGIIRNRNTKQAIDSYGKCSEFARRYFGPSAVAITFESEFGPGARAAHITGVRAKNDAGEYIPLHHIGVGEKEEFEAALTSLSLPLMLGRWVSVLPETTSE